MRLGAWFYFILIYFNMLILDLTYSNTKKKKTEKVNRVKSCFNCVIRILLIRNLIPFSRKMF